MFWLAEEKLIELLQMEPTWKPTVDAGFGDGTTARPVQRKDMASVAVGGNKTEPTA
jgi:hypothetical protein